MGLTVEWSPTHPQTPHVDPSRVGPDLSQRERRTPVTSESRTPTASDTPLSSPPTVDLVPSSTSPTSPPVRTFTPD